MRVTFITDEASQSVPEIAALAKQFALDAVELRTLWNQRVFEMTPAQIAEVKAQLDDNGLRTCCLDTPVYKCDLDDDHAKQRERLARALDVAAALGSPLVRIFSFWRRPDRELHESRVREALRLACDMARSSGVRLAVENGKRTMHCSGAELAALLDALDDPSCGAVWDPANSVLGGVDLEPVVNGFPRLKGRILHVHVKDPRVYGDGSGEYVELGLGALDIPRQIALLRECGYADYISVETHYRPGRPLDNAVLDHPGGREFSTGGYDATGICLRNLTEMLGRTGARA